MTLYITAVSDIGKIRARNEDMIWVQQELLRNDSKTFELEYNAGDSPFLVAVADGMGGHKGGAVASEFVAREMGTMIRNFPEKLGIADVKFLLRDRIQKIHDQLNHEGARDHDKTGMGSTFTGLFFYGPSVFLVNIGDSRIYRYRRGILSRFSRDHSLSEMTGNPNAPKNVLVNTFGAGANIFFDFEDISSRIIVGDIFLLCSDGLTNELEDEEIESLLCDTPSAFSLVDAARNKTGSDNISAVVISFNQRSL